MEAAYCQRVLLHRGAENLVQLKCKGIWNLAHKVSQIFLTQYKKPLSIKKEAKENTVVKLYYCSANSATETLCLLDGLARGCIVTCPLL